MNPPHAMKTRLFALLALVCLAVVSIYAENAAAIKQRMDERLPRIDALKERQVIGENIRGYVEVRGSASADDQQIVDAENRDRAAVYEIIAREAGSTAEAVGRARARKIAENSNTGVWLQDEAGRWYRK
jgi:uncharacterized protein YdbL (DUF1318 family)